METKTQRLIKALIGFGCVEKTWVSEKYRVFKHPNMTSHYYVGKRGGLRQGNTITGSISRTDHVDKIINKFYDRV